MSGQVVLVVDDDLHIRRLLQSTLVRGGYQPIEATSAAEALEKARTANPDAILLDLGLPDRDGLEIVSLLKQRSSAPILIVSARDATDQKVAALDLGADDYVTKPFGTAELLARIRAALRHTVHAVAGAPVFISGDLQVDLEKRLVSVKGEPVRLSPKEYELLRLLVQHAGKVLTHQFILRQVWGAAHEHDVQYLRVFARQLRQKIEADSARPQLLLTEPGVGYRLIG